MSLFCYQIHFKDCFYIEGSLENKSALCICSSFLQNWALSINHTTSNEIKKEWKESKNRQQRQNVNGTEAPPPMHQIIVSAFSSTPNDIIPRSIGKTAISERAFLMSLFWSDSWVWVPLTAQYPPLMRCIHASVEIGNGTEIQLGVQFNCVLLQMVRIIRTRKNGKMVLPMPAGNACGKIDYILWRKM